MLREPWKTGTLTHNGPLLQRFEDDFCRQLGVSNLIAVTNGTIALQMAIRALDLKGEIITTGFSWIATVSAIKWEGCIPVFCDIDKETLNIDVNRIRALINKHTVAIMPVHVFGNPCDIESLDQISSEFNIPVIYDAAHAVGTEYKGKSILEQGAISATSFHSTKVLNTAEGGGCITTNEQLCNKLKRIRFFGYDEDKIAVEDGLNGKMTEVHAALGICNLKMLDAVLHDRREKYLMYKRGLESLPEISFQSILFGKSNYSYFPVIVNSEKDLLFIQSALNDKSIFPRRYFYPSLNTYSNIVDYTPLPVSEDISTRILCLPLYYDLSVEDIEMIIEIISRCLK